MRKDNTIFIFAFRYALPRETCALSIVMDEYKLISDKFESCEIKQMIRDVEDELRWSKSIFKKTELEKVLGLLTKDLIKANDRMKEEENGCSSRSKKISSDRKE